MISNVFGNLSNADDSIRRSHWPMVAGIFASAAVIMSFYEIFLHLSHFNKLYLQKYVVHILMMVPIYALNAWIAMLHPSLAIYLDTLRECYEAFVIYSFMKYLTNFLYYEMDLENVIDCKPPVRHVFPLCFLPPMLGGRSFLYHCKHGILQYAVIRPTTTFLALILQWLGIYREEVYSFKYGFIYLFIINNLSQMAAMYFLYQFYVAYKSELSPMKPLPKFLSIKAVIFMSFFQSVLISSLIQIGIIRTGFGNEASKIEMARSIQDCLICFEMFIAAIFHYFAFSHSSFVDLAAYRDPIFISFLKVVNFTDERNDFFDHINQLWLRIKAAWRVKRLNIVASHNSEQVFMPLNQTNATYYDSSLEPIL